MYRNINCSTFPGVVSEASLRILLLVMFGLTCVPIHCSKLFKITVKSWDLNKKNIRHISNKWSREAKGISSQWPWSLNWERPPLLKQAMNPDTQVMVGFCNGLAIVIGLAQLHPFHDEDRDCWWVGKFECFHDLLESFHGFFGGNLKWKCIYCLDSGFEIMILIAETLVFWADRKMCVLKSLQIDAGCRQAALAGKKDMNWCGCWCLVVASLNGRTGRTIKLQTKQHFWWRLKCRHPWNLYLHVLQFAIPLECFQNHANN